MKGRTRTVDEVNLHDMIAELGCVACLKDGLFNTYVSIHHVHGRTRPDAHLHVLPLCWPHHQGDGSTLAVHVNKTAWEERYGKQDDLVEEIYEKLGLEYSAPGEIEGKSFSQRYQKPLVEGTMLKPFLPEKPSSKKKSSFPSSERIKTKIPNRKPVVKAPKKESVKNNWPKSNLTVGLTESQKAYQEKMKEEQKKARAEAKAKFEAENSEKIKEQKELARKMRREMREKAKKMKGK